ncbi:MAG: hypothetical protein SFW66_03940 [Gammaproteobacteria bacterium]|nr:hypothetical protein [Gammaproteobacteria bacterium]
MTLYNFEILAKQVKNNEIEVLEWSYPTIYMRHYTYPNGVRYHGPYHASTDYKMHGMPAGVIACGWYNRNKDQYWLLSADGKFAWVNYGYPINVRHPVVANSMTWERNYGDKVEHQLNFRPTFFIRGGGGHGWFGSEDGNIYFAGSSTFYAAGNTYGNPDRELIGHTAAITQLEFTPDKKRIISASLDGTIRIWDYTNTNRKDSVGCLRNEKAGITAFALCNSERIATGDSAGWIRLWDLASGKCIAEMYAGSRISNQCLKFINGKLVSGSEDGKVKVWDPERWNDEEKLNESCCLHTIQLDDPVSQLFLQSNGCLIAGNGNAIDMIDIESGHRLSQRDFQSGSGAHLNKIPLNGKAGPMLELADNGASLSLIVAHSDTSGSDEISFELQTSVYAGYDYSVWYELYKNTSVKLIRLSGVPLDSLSHIILAQLPALIKERPDIQFEFDYLPEKLEVWQGHLQKIELFDVPEEVKLRTVPSKAPETSAQKTLRLLREQKAAHEQEIVLLQEEIQKLKQQADSDRQQKIAIEKELHIKTAESQATLRDQEEKAQALIADQQALIQVQTKRLADNQSQIDFLSHEVEVLKEENANLDDALNRRMDMLALEMTAAESRSERFAIERDQSLDKKLTILVAESKGELTEILFNALISPQRANELRHLNLIPFAKNVNIAPIKDQLERAGVIFNVDDLFTQIENLHESDSWQDARRLMLAADQLLTDLQNDHVSITSELSFIEILEDLVRNSVIEFFTQKSSERESVLFTAFKQALENTNGEKRKLYTARGYFNDTESLVEKIRKSPQDRNLQSLTRSVSEQMVGILIDEHSEYFVPEAQAIIENSVIAQKTDLTNRVIQARKKAESVCKTFMQTERFYSGASSATFFDSSEDVRTQTNAARLDKHLSIS